jgi:hypothetical protein
MSYQPLIFDVLDVPGFFWLYVLAFGVLCFPGGGLGRIPHVQIGSARSYPHSALETQMLRNSHTRANVLQVAGTRGRFPRTTTDVALQDSPGCEYTVQEVNIDLAEFRKSKIDSSSGTATTTACSSPVTAASWLTMSCLTATNQFNDSRDSKDGSILSRVSQNLNQT